MSSLCQTSLLDAAEDVLQAAILDDDLSERLERLAYATRSECVAFSRITEGRYSWLPNIAKQETLRQFQSGKTPPLPKKILLIPPPSAKFVAREADGEQVFLSEFYQEFMRPHGLSRRAGVRLGGDDNDVSRFIIYRSERDGVFYSEDLRCLDTVLPYLRAAATVCRSRIENAATHQHSIFNRQELAVFKLGHDGLVIERNHWTEGLPPDLIMIRSRKLWLASPSEQDRLSRAINSAVSEAPVPTTFCISGAGAYERPIVAVLPLRGVAREVFSSAAAFVTIMDIARKPAEIRSLKMIGESLQLTSRETAIAGCVATGRNLSVIAQELGIGVGTVRNHLKSVMQKASVHSQAELASLISNLSSLFES